MGIRVEDCQNYKECDDDLLNMVKENFIITEDLEECHSITKEEISFSLVEIDRSKWISDEKYEDMTATYQLVSFDKRIADYPCQVSIIDYYNIILTQEARRTGSHYTDWCYGFDKPTLQQIYLENVPEVTIPAHKEIRYKTI